MRTLFPLPRPTSSIVLAILVAQSLGFYLEPSTQAPLRCPRLCSCLHYPQHNATALRCSALIDWSQVSGVKGSVAVDFVSKCLPSIRQSAFPRNVAVRKVGIAGNTDIEPSAFRNIRSTLEQVTLSGVHTYLDFSLHFLSDLPRLKKLVFGPPPSVGAPIADLKLAPFETLKGSSLDTVEIWLNSIDYYPPQVFQGLSTRRLMIVDRTWAFPGEALRRVAGLTDLALHNTALTRMRHGDTHGLQLQRLDISGSPLARLERGSLEGVRDTLRHLYLEHDLLTHVPVTALAPLRHLQHLSLKGNNLQQVDVVLKGDYCLESVALGGSAVKPLASIRPDALTPHGACLLSVALLQTNMTEFPSALLRPLPRLQTVELESSALTLLRSEALANVSLSLLSVTAPLEVIEPGVFSDLKGIDLMLSGVRLQNMSFFFQYPLGTFLNIRIHGEVECTCELAAIRHYLGLTEDGQGQPGRLRGQCVAGSAVVSLEARPVDAIFARCSDFPAVAPGVKAREGLGGGVASGASLLLTVLAPLVCWLLFAPDL